jgi:hypothetical protein
MSNIRLPKVLCVAVAGALRGSHASLDRLFLTAGASGPPPDLPHHSKWKEWLFSAGNEPNVDTLSLLGNLLEEFMDVPPNEDSPGFLEWTVSAGEFFRPWRKLAFDIIVTAECSHRPSTGRNTTALCRITTPGPGEARGN